MIGASFETNSYGTTKLFLWLVVNASPGAYVEDKSNNVTSSDPKAVALCDTPAAAEALAAALNS
jgi:hypothetical protein